VKEENVSRRKHEDAKAQTTRDKVALRERDTSFQDEKKLYGDKDRAMIRRFIAN
jgi:hypothetical protein